MKMWFVFVTGAVVGGLAVRLLMPVPPAQDEPGFAPLHPATDAAQPFSAPDASGSQVDDERRAPDDPAGERDGTANEQSAAGRASGLPDELESLSAQLQRLLDSDDEPWPKIQSVLEALARLDDPRGLERVLDCMREDCVGHGAAPYAKILAGVRDARILGAANDTLEANLAVGEDSWLHTHGYLDVIADQGGPTAAAILLSHLSSGGQLGHGAAEALALLDDPDLAQAFLERIRTGDTSIAWQLAKALASWGDTGVIADLFDLGFGATIEAERRRSVLNGTAEGMPAEFAARFVARIEFESGTHARIAGLSALGYLGQETLESVALPTILAALGSPNQAIAAAVLSTVDNNEVLHTAEVELRLAAWLPNITDPDLRHRVTRTLTRVRNR